MNPIMDHEPSAVAKLRRLYNEDDSLHEKVREWIAIEVLHIPYEPREFPSNSTSQR
jgi:hypothetical protein